ncbi:Soluble calcium-activated nucleotidase 1 [Amphibalanus amphitrite]|uniref:Soluble calcium-activated nucleotidase 1 n=1 Tax=Amphibalanus amphitrite TaxID=1232801 RepID=A0A6A4VES7_AMPAM|nr:Soluble calcium-activated nucleotidase 1 [Amphibalanus amphitrite]
MQDWRNAIFNPPPSASFTYKMGNSTVRLQSRLVVALGIIGGIVVLYLMLQRSSGGMTVAQTVWGKSTQTRCNSSYPLSKPLPGRGGVGSRYRIAVITDLDQASRREASWISLLRHGWLEWHHRHDGRPPAAELTWDEEDVTVKSSLANGGRAMELSELVSFGGHLLSVDDRTGVVYQLTNGKAVPWLILADGDGQVAKGFKGEWMTVKDNHLYVGGLGKEWTTGQ